MVEIDLGELREALQKATPGRWFVERPESGGRVLANDARRTIIHEPSCSPFNVSAQADAALIALSPTLAAAYLAKCEEVEALRAANRHLGMSRDDLLKRLESALQARLGEGEA